jgi:hypothetical protein
MKRTFFKELNRELKIATLLEMLLQQGIKIIIFFIYKNKGILCMHLDK